MGIFLKILSAPISWLYGGVVRVRHTLFDWGILKSKEYDIPIVCVGNLTVGGTGKTPHTEYLVSILSSHYKVAVLSRGYKRKTKGYVLSTDKSSFKLIGDEPRQIKLKFPEIPVAVCEKRTLGIQKLREDHPEVNLIILDDAFQHRYVEPWVNIVLMDYNRPVYKDYMLPLGRLRDTKNQLIRAHFVIMTKCPVDMRPLDYRMVSKNLELYPYQSLYFTHYVSGSATPLFSNLCSTPLHRGQGVVVFTAIADPTSFIHYVESEYTLLDKMLFEDHHTFKMSEINKLEQLLLTLPKDTRVLITEKDAVRLMGSRKISDETKAKFYYIPIRIAFSDKECEYEFGRKLSQYVRENQKYLSVHPQ